MCYYAAHTICFCQRLEIVNMAFKLRDADISYIVEKYTAGFAASEIAKDLGCNFAVVRKVLTRDGIKIRGKGEQKTVTTRRRLEAVLPDILKRYEFGIGLKAVAEEFGFAPQWLKSELDARGIKVRGRSEQQFARMAITPIETLQEMAIRNGFGIKGVAPNFETRCKAAETRFNTLAIKTSRLEREFAAILDKKGIDYLFQKNIGPYNADFVIGTVAVEIWGGQFHFTGAHLERSPRRFKYFMDSGFDAVIIPTEPGNSKITAGLAEEAIRQIQFLCTNPPAIREYRMIWRDGNFTTRFRNDGEDLSFERPFRNARDATTGRYYRVAKHAPEV